MKTLYIMLIAAILSILIIIYRFDIKGIIQPNEIIIHNDNPVTQPIHKTINKTVNKKTVINKLSCDKKCKKILQVMVNDMLKEHIHNDH